MLGTQNVIFLVELPAAPPGSSFARLSSWCGDALFRLFEASTTSSTSSASTSLSDRISTDDDDDGDNGGDSEDDSEDGGGDGGGVEIV